VNVIVPLRTLRCFSALTGHKETLMPTDPLKRYMAMDREQRVALHRARSAAAWELGMSRIAREAFSVPDDAGIHHRRETAILRRGYR
jgi:hypothetical protein